MHFHEDVRCTGYVEISPGYHTVTGAVAFGAMIFGYSGTFNGVYMAAAGMCLENLNLVGWIHFCTSIDRIIVIYSVKFICPISAYISHFKPRYFFQF